MSSFLNTRLLAVSAAVYSGQTKSAFVPSPQPGADPGAAGGGAQPMNPGGPPPGSPGAGGGVDPGMVRQMVMETMQQQGGGMGGGMGGGPGGGMSPSGAPLKPKIDVNVELMQVKNMLAKLCDALGVQMPAQDMVATPEKLMAMSQGQPTTSDQMAGGQPTSHAPIQPMQAHQAHHHKAAFERGSAYAAEPYMQGVGAAVAVFDIVAARRAALKAVS